MNDEKCNAWRSPLHFFWGPKAHTHTRARTRAHARIPPLPATTLCHTQAHTRKHASHYLPAHTHGDVPFYDTNAWSGTCEWPKLFIQQQRAKWGCLLHTLPAVDAQALATAALQFDDAMFEALSQDAPAGLSPLQGALANEALSQDAPAGLSPLEGALANSAPKFTDD